jgi:hypothetical protein
MREAEKIVFHDCEVAFASAARFGALSFPRAASGGVLVQAPKTGTMMRAAIVLTLFAIANAHRLFAIPAFAVAAVIMLAATLRPSRLVLRSAGGETRALVPRRLRAIKAPIEGAPRPRARSGSSSSAHGDFASSTHRHEIRALVLSLPARRSKSLCSATSCSSLSHDDGAQFRRSAARSRQPATDRQAQGRDAGQLEERRRRDHRRLVPTKRRRSASLRGGKRPSLICASSLNRGDEGPRGPQPHGR